jgi:hypothetical protein
LYNLFRQEFIKLNEVPLNSDSFSKFGRHDAEVHCKEIVDATHRLEREVIPNFAAELLKKMEDENVQLFDTDSTHTEELSQLIADLHVQGINVRYLMILFKHVQASQHLQSLIVTEMVARVAKDELRRIWRAVHAFDDSEYKLQALNYFNLLFGASQQSKEYLDGPFTTALKNKFTIEEGHVIQDFNWKSLVNHELLFYRLQQLTGVQLHVTKAEDAESHIKHVTADDGESGKHDMKRVLQHISEEENPFSECSVGQIVPSVKHIHRISFEEGTALSKLALTKTGDIAFKLFQLAGDKYKHCLSIKPNDHRALFNWGLSLAKQAALLVLQPNLPLADTYYQLAADKYERYFN